MYTSKTLICHCRALCSSKPQNSNPSWIPHSFLYVDTAGHVEVLVFGRNEMYPGTPLAKENPMISKNIICTHNRNSVVGYSNSNFSPDCMIMKDRHSEFHKSHGILVHMRNPKPARNAISILSVHQWPQSCLLYVILGFHETDVNSRLKRVI